MNSSVAKRPLPRLIIVQRRRNHSGRCVRVSVASSAEREAAPNSYARSGRPFGRLSTSPEPITLHTSWRFWFSVWFGERLRIFSVPCGGLSWRRDRLPKDDGVRMIHLRGIESHAREERHRRTASSQLCASSPSGPPRDDRRSRSCCSKPGHRRGVPSKSNGVGHLTHGEIPRCNAP